MKTAVITGAGGAIGARVAERLAERGYRVGVLDRDGERANAVAKKIGNASALAADVTDESAVAAALVAFGAIPDLLVNLAAVTRFGSLIAQGVEGFRLAVDVNLMGTFIPCLLVGRQMVERGSGVIVNTTSINAITPRPDTGAYPATKAAIARLTEQMAIEWGPHGVRVNCVAPGFIDAGMSAPFYANRDMHDLRSASVPLRRLGLVDDVAAAVAFLASDEAAYITGHQLVVDGGVVHSLLAQLPLDANAARAAGR